MGISLFKSCSIAPNNPRAVAPNPDPSRYDILRSESVANCLIVEARYHGCTNFDGRKIMVYENVADVAELLALTHGKLDPHFAGSHPSPVARLIPDDLGWALARIVAKELEGF